MENCKNCKYFNERPMSNLKSLVPNPSEFGTCVKVYSTNSNSHLLTPQENVIMIVGINFGCIHHKKAD